VFQLTEPLHLDITSNKKHICIEIQHYITKTDSSPFISSNYTTKGNNLCPSDQ